MVAVFLKLVNLSISANWLVLAVLAARAALRRAPRWTAVLLWGAVALRLMLPVSVESGLSLIPSTETVSPVVVQFDPSPTIDSGIPVIDGALNPVISQRFAAAPVASVNPLFVWTELAGAVWLIGLAALLLHALAGWLRLRRRVAASVPGEEGVRLCDEISTPFILGVIRPRIYLPSGLDGAQTRYVLAHERAHLARRDHWWKLLGFALLAVYWFDPLVWLAYGLLCRDLELACDERVLRDMSAAERRAYSEVLLSCSMPRRMAAACPLAFGEVGVKTRVKNALRGRRPARWTVFAAAAVCAALAVCFLTDPPGLGSRLRGVELVSGAVTDRRDGKAEAELNRGQLDELESRLAGLGRTRRSEQYASLSPLYQLSAQTESGAQLVASGYLEDGGAVDIQWDGARWTVSDAEFCGYLSRVCAGADTTPAERVQPFDPAGSYQDEMGSMLTITPEDGGTYSVEFGIYKLLYMEHAEGRYDPETCIFTFSGVDDGGGALAARVVSDGGGLLVTLTESAHSDCPAGTELRFFSIPAEAQIEGTVFSYGGESWDLAEESPHVNAVTDCRAAGDTLVLTAHVGPKNEMYFLFDTRSRSFIRSFPGTNLIWQGDDLSTAVYSFWSQILTLDGRVLADLELAENEYVRDLSFGGPDGASLTAAVESEGGTCVMLIPLTLDGAAA